MNTRNDFVSLRTRLERLVAAVVFGGAAILVVHGTIAMCMQPALLAA